MSDYTEPTDDEREALLRLIGEGPGERVRTADRILAAGFRRQGPITDEWEYAQSEVLDDGTVAFGNPVDTLEEATRRRDLDRMNYPWPEELGVGRRRKAGPWEPVETAGVES